MSSYFDTKRQEIAAARANSEIAWNKLEAIDHEIIRDCSRAIVQPGFPGQLVNNVLDVMLKWSIVAQDGVHSQEWSPETSAIATAEEYAAALGRLEWDLHSIWHEVSRISAAQDPEGRGWGDNPLNFMFEMEGRAEEMRAARRLTLRSSK